MAETSLAESAERLCVTPRTVGRDVGRLRGLGYQVRAVPGPGGGYELGAGSALPPAVIDRVLPDPLRRRAAALQSAVVPLALGEPVDPDLLGLLALACRDSERLRFSYTDGDGRTSNRHAVPFRLVSTGRRWYLVARDLDRDDWRSFRLDRIAGPRPTGVRTRPADPPGAARFVAEGVSTRGYPSQARVLLHAPP